MTKEQFMANIEKTQKETELELLQAEIDKKCAELLEVAKRFNEVSRKEIQK